MSRAFTGLIVCGIVAAVGALVGVVAGVMSGSGLITAIYLVGAASGLGMATFGLIGKKQFPPRP
jgi:hypothetical protein